MDRHGHVVCLGGQPTDEGLNGKTYEEADRLPPWAHSHVTFFIPSGIHRSISRVLYARGVHRLVLSSLVPNDHVHGIPKALPRSLDACGTQVVDAVLHVLIALARGVGSLLRGIRSRQSVNRQAVQGCDPLQWNTRRLQLMISPRLAHGVINTRAGVEVSCVGDVIQSR
ncbi:hypothetical protein FA95DRAFT_68869 [Auriscalpium vulgare]|uniref:Uncharacterized protein n=1 Tax=Auriscalpium vulgare TaxID=40419 RepID=A0ACB8S7K1_9AGAM|nr:hypothetical protein FA95DRAFT_68869 [Auriscalpium vulgare]